MYIFEESSFGVYVQNTLIRLIAINVNPTHELAISAVDPETGNTSSAILYRISKKDDIVCVIHGVDQELDSLGELTKLAQEQGVEITEVIKKNCSCK